MGLGSPARSVAGPIKGPTHEKWQASDNTQTQSLGTPLPAHDHRDFIRGLNPGARLAGDTVFSRPRDIGDAGYCCRSICRRAFIFSVLDIPSCGDPLRSAIFERKRASIQRTPQTTQDKKCLNKDPTTPRRHFERSTLPGTVRITIASASAHHLRRPSNKRDRR